MTNENVAVPAARPIRTRAARDIKRPPVTPASDIDELFARMRTIAAPPSVTGAWAKGFGLAPDITPVLRWLGVADEDGIVDANRWNQVRMPATRKDALAERVREAYAAIFDQIDVGKVTREDLDEAFVKAYEMGDPVRYVRAFAVVCRHAGIDLGVSATNQTDATTATKPKEQKRTSPQATPAKAQHSRSQTAKPDRNPPTGRDKRGLGINVNIEIPAGWSEDKIRARLRMVEAVLDEFGGG